VTLISGLTRDWVSSIIIPVLSVYCCHCCVEDSSTQAVERGEGCHEAWPSLSSACHLPTSRLGCQSRRGLSLSQRVHTAISESSSDQVKSSQVCCFNNSI